MKLIQALMPMLFMSVLLNAQSKPIPADSMIVQSDNPRRQAPALSYFLKYKGKTFSIDSTAIKNGALPSRAIRSLDLVIDKNELERYGNAANNGAIILSLTEVQSSKTFRSIKKYLKEIPMFTQAE